MDSIVIIAQNPVYILLIALWTLPWKGVALWKAARLYHRKWFIALLVINLLAIPEIFYIFAIARKAERETAVPESETGAPR